MQERKIKEKGLLLNDNGELLDHGYSKSLITTYNKENIKNKKRIKEWDYYLIGDNRFALCLTISNLSYVAVISASVIDYENRKHYDKHTDISICCSNSTYSLIANRGEHQGIYHT